MKRRVLLTGAGGFIGRFLSQALAGDYDLRLTDRLPPAADEPPRITADLSDADAVRELCQGVDTVVHFAANPSPAARWPSLLSDNIDVTYKVFAAAAEAGCRRLVFASSIHAALAYPDDDFVTSAAPPRPFTLYGASKVCGEALASVFAARGAYSAICLRLGMALPRQRVRFNPQVYDIRTVITFDDIARLVIAAIAAPEDIRFGVFFGISNNREMRFDISDARERLHYQPQDDAFVLAERHRALEDAQL